MTTNKPTLGFIGAGKVGITLARLCYTVGYEVVAVHSRNQVAAHDLAERVAARTVLTPDEVIQSADLTLLTVNDDAIETVVTQIGLSSLQGKAVIHTSGVKSASALSALNVRGASVGSLHPAFPFADVETSLANLPGAVFAVEAQDERLRDWLRKMVVVLRGRVLNITAEEKALYHSALVFASNYTVTLYAIAERLLLNTGAEPAIVADLLTRLMTGALNNLHDQGIPQALTGPLVRKDSGTLQAHLNALRPLQLDGLYRELARHTFPVLRARGIDTDSIEQILRWSENHAIDHS